MLDTTLRSLFLLTLFLTRRLDDLRSRGRTSADDRLSCRSRAIHLNFLFLARALRPRNPQNSNAQDAARVKHLHRFDSCRRYRRESAFHLLRKHDSEARKHKRSILTNKTRRPRLRRGGYSTRAPLLATAPLDNVPTSSLPRRTVPRASTRPALHHHSCTFAKVLLFGFDDETG